MMNGNNIGHYKIALVMLIGMSTHLHPMWRRGSKNITAARLATIGSAMSAAKSRFLPATPLKNMWQKLQEVQSPLANLSRREKDHPFSVIPPEMSVLERLHRFPAEEWSPGLIEPIKSDLLTPLPSSAQMAEGIKKYAALLREYRAATHTIDPLLDQIEAYEKRFSTNDEVQETKDQKITSFKEYRDTLVRAAEARDKFEQLRSRIYAIAAEIEVATEARISELGELLHKLIAESRKWRSEATRQRKQLYNASIEGKETLDNLVVQFAEAKQLAKQQTAAVILPPVKGFSMYLDLYRKLLSDSELVVKWSLPSDLNRLANMSDASNKQVMKTIANDYQRAKVRIEELKRVLRDYEQSHFDTGMQEIAPHAHYLEDYVDIKDKQHILRERLALLDGRIEYWLMFSGEPINSPRVQEILEPVMRERSQVQRLLAVYGGAVKEFEEKNPGLRECIKK